MSRSALGPLVLALAACASVPEPEAPRFVFQDSFWVNLHHCLRAEARRRERGEALHLAPEVLAPSECEAWCRALEAYRPWAQRSLLFDAELLGMHVALSAADVDAPLPDALVGELTAVLNGAAPVFRAHLWPERARENERWIASTRPAVERLAAQVTDGTAAAYGLAWPIRPILVDVTPETGPDLAYTTDRAPGGFAGLATISPSVAGGSAAAVECVFHEAAHVVDAAIVLAVEEASARAGLAPPPELWHAILFYTAGVLTERALGEAGTYRADLARGFPAYLPALDEHWRPYLDGAGTLESTLDAVVRTVSPGHAGL